MKRILFVDDEPRILEGLGRLLRGMRQEWDMHFANSGPAALEAMREQPFDVVISDMRMPGMDGAELLAQVRERYPEVVRIILSGHADTNAIMRAFGVTHQYLSKPCPPEVLKNVVSRAFALRALLSSNSLKRLVSGMDSVPGMPSARAELADALKEEEPSPTVIGRVVSKDFGLTAQLLKLAQAAQLGLGGAAQDARRTVALLGPNTIRALVAEPETSSNRQAPAIPGFSMADLWQHSTQTAAIAQVIAKAESATAAASDEAYLAGMLHDIGHLALVNKDPELYTEILAIQRQEGLSWHDAEMRILNATHAEIGAYLLGLWGFPDSLVEAVAYHERPADAPTPGFGLPGVLHVANCLARHPQATGPTTCIRDWISNTSAPSACRIGGRPGERSPATHSLSVKRHEPMKGINMERSKILLVDDEPKVTAALKRALRQEPYEVFTADSAAAALQILATNDIDVVISDERMPGMSGSVFLGQVRQSSPDTVRIILSGQANLEDAVRAINEGEIYRFFIKPFNATDLSITIRQAIQHKQLVKQSRRLLREYQKQNAVIDELERNSPGITHLPTDEGGAILVADDEHRTAVAGNEQQFQRADNDPTASSPGPMLSPSVRFRRGLPVAPELPRRGHLRPLTKPHGARWPQIML